MKFRLQLQLDVDTSDGSVTVISQDAGLPRVCVWCGKPVIRRASQYCSTTCASYGRRQLSTSEQRRRLTGTLGPQCE